MRLLVLVYTKHLQDKISVIGGHYCGTVSHFLLAVRRSVLVTSRVSWCSFALPNRNWIAEENLCEWWYLADFYIL